MRKKSSNNTNVYYKDAAINPHHQARVAEIVGVKEQPSQMQVRTSNIDVPEEGAITLAALPTQMIPLQSLFVHRRAGTTCQDKYFYTHALFYSMAKLYHPFTLYMPGRASIQGNEADHAAPATFRTSHSQTQVDCTLLISVQETCTDVLHTYRQKHHICLLSSPLIIVVTPHLV